MREVNSKRLFSASAFVHTTRMRLISRLMLKPDELLRITTSSNVQGLIVALDVLFIVITEEGHIEDSEGFIAKGREEGTRCSRPSLSSCAART